MKNICVRGFYVTINYRGTAAVKRRRESINEIIFPEKLVTDEIRIVLEHPSGLIPAALFAVKCYE